eukprot:766417-Hanusia_phi.AAC.3
MLFKVGVTRWRDCARAAMVFCSSLPAGERSGWRKLVRMNWIVDRGSWVVHLLATNLTQQGLTLRYPLSLRKLPALHVSLDVRRFKRGS